jgi:hypothetical protein
VARLGIVGGPVLGRGDMGADRRLPQGAPLVPARGRAVRRGGERCYGGQGIPEEEQKWRLRSMSRAAGLQQHSVSRFGFV